MAEKSDEPVETTEVRAVQASYSERCAEVAKAFLPMGFIAFGGPQAHIALFLKTFVEGKAKWLDEQRFMELMSLGQALPGPTSTWMCNLSLTWTKDWGLTRDCTMSWLD